MHCAFCLQPLGYVHGHAACLRNVCPMFGLNQAECCAGDRGDCVPTSTVASAPSDADRANRAKFAEAAVSSIEVLPIDPAVSRIHVRIRAD